MNPSISLDLVLTQADIAYASEDGPLKIYLEASSQESHATKKSSHVEIATFRTPEWKENLRISLEASELQHAQDPLHLQVVGVREGREPETLGRLIVPLAKLRKTLASRRSGFVARETVPLKYRGLASIETQVSCGKR